MRRVFVASVMVPLLTGCGLLGNDVNPAAPTTPSPGGAPATPPQAASAVDQAHETLESARCALGPSPFADTPLIASWPPEQQALLDQGMQHGIVVLKYDACGLRVLDHCKVDGGYRFVGTESASRDVTLGEKATLAEHVLGDYRGLVTKVVGGEKVDLQLVAVGSLESTKAIVLPTSMSGDCEGATHYVSSALVGSYRIDSASAGGAKSTEPLAGEPAPATCAQAAPGATAAPTGCDHKLRVRLAPARFIEIAATRAHEKASCKDDDPVGCTLACVHANASACTTLGWMLEGGHRLPPDPPRAAMLYRGACIAGYQLACNNLAIMFMQGRGVDRDEGQAAPLLRSACSGGFTRSCANLGTLYRDGIGVDKDPKRALSLFQRACDAMDGEACGMLGRMMVDDGAAANVAFTKGCLLRDADSCNNLAVMMLDAAGEKRNEAAAVHMFSVACSGGLGIACRNLGAMYANGLGVARDVPHAIDALDEACGMGATDACGKLGSLYAEGKDAAKGFGLLDEACKKGSQDGCARLASLYEDGRGVARDPAKAFGLLKDACSACAATACERIAGLARKAGKVASKPAAWLAPLCDHGQQSACTAVGDLLAGGVSGHRDAEGAASRYLHACDAGESTACARGAHLLTAMPKRLPDSTHMFQRACDAGDAGSCFDLAQMYLQGKGVAKDEGHAVTLLEAGCRIPDARSCERAAQIYEHRKKPEPMTAQSYYRRACQAGATPTCAKAAGLPAAPPLPDPVAGMSDTDEGANTQPGAPSGGASK